MRKPMLFVISLLLWPFIANAKVDPGNLIKVTPDNQEKCTTYYNYQGELYCGTGQTTPPIDPKAITYEKQKIIFDERPWLAAWGKDTPEIVTVEYVPEGDNIDNWNELVTSQFIPNTNPELTPKLYMDTFVNGLQKSGFKPIITVHEDTGNQLLFEFQIEQPKNQQQDELQLITRTKSGLYLLHYVIKKPDMGKANREKWIELLKKSKTP